jgi:hypothetical protein
VAAWATGCDNGKTDNNRSYAEAATPAVSTVLSAPLPPAPTRVFVTVDAVIVGKDRVLLTDPAFATAVSTTVASAPGIAGTTVEVDAARPAKLSAVYSVFSALRRANARAEVHTTTRDKLDLVVTFSFPRSADPCAVVADIDKDAAVSVWTVGGTTAKKFTHGFAGPDITLGSDAVRKLAASCSSGVWFVSADPSIPWGSVFDLAATSMGAGDASAGMNVPDVAALPSEPVPGHTVGKFD